jgi:hypothetical protein
MQLTTTSIVDPQPVIDFYRQNGLATDLLEKCNCIEFRYIDGVGEGHILITNDGSFGATENISITDTLTGSISTYNMSVLSIIDLEHPAHSGIGLRVLQVAEPKYRLKRIVAYRNFNVIYRRKVTATAGETLAPDTTPLTLAQIIGNFTGMSVSYTGDPIVPYDVFIQGMDSVSAIDKLCSTYGLLWTFSGSSINIVAPSTTVGSSNWFGVGVPIDPINDIRVDVDIEPPLNSIQVTYPILETNVRQVRSNYTDSWSVSAPGRTLNVYNPFFPAIYVSNSLDNAAGIASNSGMIRDNMQVIAALEGNYVVRHIYRPAPLAITPRFFSVRYADFGAGPRTIYSSRNYPYQQPPSSEVNDRQAKNWIGYLADDYNNTPSWFIVVPSIGIDGIKPSGLQYVFNTYNWDNGRAGALIRVEWSSENYRWLALQQEYECPEEEEEPIPPPPPPEEYTGSPDWDVLE